MSSSLFFEAVEKRLEVRFKLESNTPNLLHYPNSFWQQLLDHCGATIINSMKTADCHAYVLSESSLFVFQQRLILITCGNCPLVKCALALIEKFGKHQIVQLVFQRQPERQPQRQITQFQQDEQLLAQRLSNNQYQQAIPLMFHYQDATQASVTTQPQPCYRLQLQQLSGAAFTAIQGQDYSADQLQFSLGLSQWAQRYQINDWVFKPIGYSANGLAGDHYFTLHLSPDATYSLLSVETNDAQLFQHLTAHLQGLFSPEQCLIVSAPPTNSLIKSDAHTT